MKKLSIRLKITLWFSVILILVVALTYLVILSVSGQIIQKTIRDNLIQTVESNVDEAEYYSSADMATMRNDVDYYVRYGDGYIEIDDDFLNQVNGVYTSLCSVDGDLIYGENPIIRETADLDFLDSQVQRITVDGTLYYVFDRKPETEGLEEMWLRGVVSENQGDAEMSDISRYSLILLPSLVLIAIIGGYLIACRMLRPIRQIADTAEQISQGDDLKKRIVLNEGDDELHQLAGQFNDMFARLDTSFQTQQQFVSDASHELRTPVAVINAQCELTLEQERTPEEYEEAMRVVWRQGRKMNRLINSMLDFTRLKLQPEKYTKEKMNLSELTDSVCQDMALIREKEITLTCEVEPDVYCLGNRELLTRLLNNLISNAYRYGKENGQIRVTLATDKDGKITLSVQDDGIGIAAEDLPHIFDRFYQADGSRSSGGSGLGLAMAQEIAAFHEGEISVDSVLGVGSTFCIHLKIC